jgi:3-dehydroquinate synthase
MRTMHDTPSHAATVTVPAQPPRVYAVTIAPNALTALGDTARQTLGPKPSHAFLVRDTNLPSDTVDRAADALEHAGFRVTHAGMHATETNKSLQTAERLLAELAAAKGERADPVIALGGGITGDVAGFVAATYRRGVPLIQCPTTLLAMVDAAVGGKTAVNLGTPEGHLQKNLAGAFHHPRAVIADTATLDSLPDRHLNAGLAECVKHALISRTFDTEDDLFRWTRTNLNHFQERDHARLAELVARNTRVKAAVVNRDPDETSDDPRISRQLLNLGHTFAHAIETLPGLSPINEPDDAEFGAPLVHGEAVALGLVAAAHTSVALGSFTQRHADAVRTLVEELGIASRLKELPPDDELLSRMMHDKKVAGGELRLVVPEADAESGEPGDASVRTAPDDAAVRAGLAAIRA